jgi:SAM-dependent methyltransferase
MPVDETKLNELLTRTLQDWASAMSAPLVVLGDRLGLYRAMAGAGPLRPGELAERVDVPEPYVRDWLANQAAGGYVDYDAETGRFRLTEEQALVFADDTRPCLPDLARALRAQIAPGCVVGKSEYARYEDFPPPCQERSGSRIASTKIRETRPSAACMLGAFQIAAAYTRDEPRLAEAIRGGCGFGWHEHDPEVFTGVARFFRPGYQANIASSWIPALDGVDAKLRAGATVADVGCGHGLSAVFMAEAYPCSTFVGFDYHEASIEQARKLAAESGVGDRVRFEIAPATGFPGTYDLVTLFDCFHDMGDPLAAAAHIRTGLAPDGTCMIVEPAASDRVIDNLTPLGRGYYAASTLACVPSSLAQETGAALGAQAGEARLTRVLHEAGFSRVRRATETPFNIIIEARA